MISQNIKKQIIDQTNIVEVVGEVVQLTKKGSSYFGLCPFHNDNHPSMSVNNEKRCSIALVAILKEMLSILCHDFIILLMIKQQLCLQKDLALKLAKHQQKRL